MASRSHYSPLASWWRTVDRLMLAALLAVMLAGIVLSLAASPPVAARLGLDPFYFVNRHVMYLIPALARDVGHFALAATTDPARSRWWCSRSASRWWSRPCISGRRSRVRAGVIIILGVNIQPSEFLKPAFVILIAWLFAESSRTHDVPANALALGLLLGTIAILVLQPDFGQTMLVALVWGALFFMAGMRMIWVIGLLGAAGCGLAGATLIFPHVAGRIRRFMDPASGDTFQVDTAVELFMHGGWFGRGPGEGTVKRILPDAHADFVFAVAAEEFGIVLCLALVALIAFIVLRALTNAMRNSDPFARFATAGLAILFGTQSAINMAVNLALIPAKGMTLPFISYGGSSMISLAYGVGMLLALMRERPASEKLGLTEKLVLSGSLA